MIKKIESCNISFIIPAYNCEHTISETVESILKNIEADDEVIIVNDCSTDNTLYIIQQYANQNAQIKIVQHKVNKGGAATRNTAVENSSNDLIFCLDSDNVLLENTICKLKQALLDADADAAAFQSVTFFSKKITNISHKWFFKNKYITLQDALCSGVCPISSGNYLYKKSSWRKVGGYPEFAKSLDAWGFGLRQLANNHKMIILEGSTYLHRVGHESYWIREAKINNLSTIAWKILEPFFDKLAPVSKSYLLTEKGMSTWFGELEARPIIVKNNLIGQSGVVLNRNNKLVSKISMLSKIIFKIKTALV
jgi:glycosyltransferase involved in cell wall biosynthesis